MSGLGQLLETLLGNDDAARNAAEGQIRQQRSADPNGLCVALVSAVVDVSLPEQHRMMACSLLRQALVRADDSVWPALRGDVRAHVKAALLAAAEAAATVTPASLRRKLCDTIAELGGYLSDPKEEARGGWAELLPFVLQLTRADADPLRRETGYGIFSTLAVVLGPTPFRANFSVVKDVLQAGLVDTAVAVRLNALLATVSFLQIMEQQDDAHLNQFRGLLPNMLECISAAIGQNREMEAQSALEIFVTLAEEKPLFFKPWLQVVVTTMFQIASAEQLADETRRYGLEVLLTLCESKPVMMKKMQGFVDAMVRFILSWMITEEDFEDWYNFEDVEPDTTNADVANEALDRLSLALHGKTIVPTLFGHLNDLIVSPDWRFRSTAMLSITLCAEGCKAVLEPLLGEVMRNVSLLVADAHPRVRWAAVNCIAQLCTDFEPKIQKHHAPLITELVARAMTDTVPRVQAHGAAAVINFISTTEIDAITPHVPTLLSSLRNLFTSPQLKVQETAITATTMLADMVGEGFLPYYDHFVPPLKAIIQRAKDKQFRDLRGKAMNCLCTIGAAVGKERFSGDALEVMREMMSTQCVEADDPQISYLETGFVLVSECLGHDFAQFLPSIIQPTLQRAALKPDVKQISDSDGDIAANADGTLIGINEDGWDTVEIGDQTVGIHTEQLENKADAISVLSAYASTLGGDYAPWVQQTAEVVVPELGCYYHDNVRKNAYDILPNLVASVRSAGKDKKAYMQQLWQFIFEALMVRLPEEPEESVLVDGLEALYKCVGLMEEPTLSPEQLMRVAGVLESLMHDCIEANNIIAERRKEEDEQDEEAEDDSGSTDDVLIRISGAIEKLADTHRDAFVPAFQEKLLSAELSMLDPQRPISERQNALFAFAAMARFSTVAAVSYAKHFMPAMLQYAGDMENAVVREAACYGIGVSSAALGAQFVPLLPDALAKLRAAIVAPGAFDDKNVIATEHAITAVMRIADALSANVDVKELVGAVLQFLPLSNDDSEAAECHGLLIKLIEKFPTAVLGSALENASKIMKIFSEIAGTPLLEDDMAARAVTIIQQLAPHVHADFIPSLPPETAERFQKFLAQQH